MEFAARLGAFLLVVLLGVWLRKSGRVTASAQQAVEWLCLHVTLPAAILSGFSPAAARGLVPVAGMAFMLAASPFFVGMALRRGAPAAQRACDGIALCGYNIGSFTLPLAQAFLGPQAITVLCLFDVGNAFVTCGGSYALAGRVLGEKGPALGIIWARLRRSAPFWANLFMLCLACGGLQLPGAVLELLAPMARANGFISMLLLGLLLGGGERQAGGCGHVGRLAAVRCGWALFGAAACLLLVPVPTEARQVMAMACFSPLSMLAPLYVGRCGGQPSVAGKAYLAYLPVSVLGLCLWLWRLTG